MLGRLQLLIMMGSISQSTPENTEVNGHFAVIAITIKLITKYLLALPVISNQRWIQSIKMLEIMFLHQQVVIVVIPQGKNR